MNWSTFLLEILNFLVLVWILKRFLYKPVQETIARRKAQVDEIIGKADAIRGEAEALKLRYENRLKDWEEEKEAGREALRQELSVERDRSLEVLRRELEQEREKERVVEDRQRQDRLRRDQEVCLQQGARFVSRLLSGFATPDLEGQLLALALKQIEELPVERAESLRLALNTSRGPVIVHSAHPLTPAQREQLAGTLTGLSGMAPDCSFAEDSSLLAGLRITIGPWVLHANLADELKSFADSAHDRG